MSLSKIISGDKANSLLHWQMPDVGTNQAVKKTYRDDLAALGGSLPTVKDLELVQKRAYEESYREGYADGLQISKDEQQKVINFLQEILGKMNDLLLQVDDAVKKEIAYLALAIAKQVIIGELKSSPETILSIVEESLNFLPALNEKVYIHLNPEDAKTVRQMLEAGEVRKNWQIIEDEEMLRGGCKVLTKNSNLDNSIENKLARIAAKFLDHYQEPSQELNLHG